MRRSYISTFCRHMLASLFCLIILSGLSVAKDTDIYSVATKQNAYILLDNSGSMDYAVYENSVDYGAMYDYLVTLNDPTPPFDRYITDYANSTFDWSGNIITANTPFYQNHQPRNSIFLWLGDNISVTVATVDGKAKAFTGDAGKNSITWKYPDNLINTNTYIDASGNFAAVDTSKAKRLSTNSDGEVLLDNQALPLGMNIKLHDLETLVDGTVIDNGFAGMMKAPGFYFSGYKPGTTSGSLTTAASGDKDIYFFITGNWANMHTVFNLNYTTLPSGVSYPAGASKGDSACRFESFVTGSWPEVEKSVRYPASGTYPANLTGTTNDSVQTITQPGATKIRVHFSSFDINSATSYPVKKCLLWYCWWEDEPDPADWLFVYDSSGNQIAKYNNANKPTNNWTVDIPGNTARLVLTSGSQNTGSGYSVDKIEYLNASGSYKMQNRLEVAKEALSYTVEAFSNKMNWGFSTFKYTDGGSGDGATVDPLLNPSTQAATQVAAIQTKVNGISPLYGTPLGEALQDVYQKGFVDQKNVLKNSLCRKNYAIVITDGFPSDDTSWNRITGVTITDSDGDGWTADPSQYDNPAANYYDDVARYMYTHSWLDGSAVDKPESSYVNVISHQISFGAVHPLLQNAAKESGGKYITVYNKAQLVSAFYAITLDITNSVAFTAPVASVDSSNKLQNGSDMYFGFFFPQDGHSWAGNLKKFSLGKNPSKAGEWTILDAKGNQAVNSLGELQDNLACPWDVDTDTNDSDKYGGFDIKEDGAGSLLLKQVTNNFKAESDYYKRNIYTIINGTMTKVSKTSITKEMLNVSSDTERNQLINYLYGYTNETDGTTNAYPKAVRDWVLGSIIHSKPIVLEYYTDSTATTVSKRYVVVGANDGMLHVFDDSPSSTTAGKEVFAFIPYDLLPKIQQLPKNDLVEMVDGGSTLFRANNQPKYLIFGEGRGGKTYWNLDVSNSDPLQWAVKWSLTSSTFGQTWAEVQTASIPTAIDSTTGVITFKDVVIFSGGYDDQEDNFPEPFLDVNNSGTPYTTGTTIDTNEWKTSDTTQDINRNTLYDVYNPGRNSYGRTIKIVDIESPATSVTATSTIGSTSRSVTLLPFQAIGLDSATTNTVSSDYSTFTRADMPYCFVATPAVIVGTLDYYYYDTAAQKLVEGHKPNTLLSVYATDIYANIFRINFTLGFSTNTNGSTNDPTKWSWGLTGTPWEVTKIFSSNPGSTSLSGSTGGADSTADQGRKAFFPPSISWGGSCKYFDKSNYFFPEATFKGTNRIASLFFGTGDREHPNYKLNKDRFYAIYDDSTVSGSTKNTSGIEEAFPVSSVSYKESNLLNVTCDEMGTDSNVTASTKAALKTKITDDATYDVSGVSTLEKSIHENDAKGWYIVMEDQSSCSTTVAGTIDTSSATARDYHVGEKVLSPSTLYAGILYFTSYQPKKEDPCRPQGNGFTYALDYCTGSAAYNLNKNNDVSTTGAIKMTLTDRYNKYTNIMGIPSGFSIVTQGGQAGAMAMIGGKIVGPQGPDTLKIKTPGQGLQLYYWRESNSLSPQ